MRNFILLVFAVLLTASQMAAQNFEGVVSLTSKGDVGIDAEFMLKGDKVKTTMTQDGKEVVMITDKSTGDMYMLSEEKGQKTATKMNISDIPAHMISTAKISDDMVVTVTNERKKVNGYDCVKVIGKSSTTESEAWVTEEIKLEFADIMPGKQGVNDQVLKSWTENEKVKGFPVKIKSKNLETQTETEYDVEVDAKKIKDKEFEIGEDYMVRDVSQFMQMMENAPNQQDIEEMRNRVKEMQEKAKATQMKAMPAEKDASEEAQPAGDGGGK
jgi:hypothetical protein